MKPLFYSCILALFITACANNKDKERIATIAKTKAEKYIKKTLPTPGSYHPIAFGELDSIMLSHLNDKNYIRLDDSIMEIEAIRFREMGENFKLFQERKASGFYEKKQAGFRKQRDAIAKRVKPRFAGYKLEHKFKAVDTTGDTVLNNYVFCFDPKGNLTKVMK